MTYNEFIALKPGQEIKLFGDKYIVLKIDQARFCVDTVRCEHYKRKMTIGGDLLIGEGAIIKEMSK